MYIYIYLYTYYKQYMYIHVNVYVYDMYMYIVNIYIICIRIYTYWLLTCPLPAAPTNGTAGPDTCLLPLCSGLQQRVRAKAPRRRRGRKPWKHKS